MLKLPPGQDGRHGLKVQELLVDKTKKTAALVVHSVALDGCAGKAYLSARELGGVFSVHLSDMANYKYKSDVSTKHGLEARTPIDV